MRLVIDTNVLVSALLKPGSVPDRLLEAIWARELEVVYDARIHHEWARVVARRSPATGSPGARDPRPEGADVSIEINNESGFDIDESALQRLVLHAFDALKVHRDAELAIQLVDEGAMERLHIEWMDEPGVL